MPLNPQASEFTLNHSAAAFVPGGGRGGQGGGRGGGAGDGCLQARRPQQQQQPQGGLQHNNKGGNAQRGGHAFGGQKPPRHSPAAVSPRLLPSMLTGPPHVQRDWLMQMHLQIQQQHQQMLPPQQQHQFPFFPMTAHGGASLSEPSFSAGPAGAACRGENPRLCACAVDALICTVLSKVSLYNGFI